MKKQIDWGTEVGKHAVLILGALVVILPFYLMISFYLLVCLKHFLDIL